MSAWFDRFTKVWASTGGLDDPTDAEANAGLIFLGPAPPTVELHNSMFQWNDRKDGYLFRQIKGVTDFAGLTLVETDNLTLLHALQNKFQPILGFTPVQQGGGAGQGTNKVYIGWNAAGLKAQVDATDQGLFAFLGKAQNWTASQNFQAITSTDIYSSAGIRANTSLTGNTVSATLDISAGRDIGASRNVTASNLVYSALDVTAQRDVYGVRTVSSGGSVNSAVDVTAANNGRFGNAIYISTNTVSDFTLAASPGARGLAWNADYAYEFQESVSTVHWFGPGKTVLMSLAPNGSLNMIGRAAIGNDIVYTNRGGNAFGFQWDGTYVYAVINGVGIALQAVSDERAKQDVAPSTFDSLAAIKAIPLYEYRMKDVQNPANPKAAAINTPIIPVGFVSQRLHETFPEGAVVGSDTNMWSVNSYTMIAALCGAVQQLSATVDELTARLNNT